MVTGHLEIKKGYYYVVLNYVDELGKRHRPWIATGLTAKGNKRRAEAELARIRSSYMPEKIITDENEAEIKDNMLYADYLKSWLEIARSKVKIATYGSYCSMAESNIIPYFRKKAIPLKALKPQHIQTYYSFRLKTVTPNTVIHEHAVIYQSLKYAEKIGLIPRNVAAQVDRPKKNDFQPVFLDAKELDKVFAAVKGTKVELPVLVSAFYGLRRGEVIGLKWSAIDFERNSITINHTVTTVKVDGKYRDIEQDSAKTKAGLRTLPLVADFKEYFLEVKEAQELNKKVCGNCYNYAYEDYVFVDEMGDRIKPGYLTERFPAILKKHGLKHMRFHDLRHCCASLLLANGISLKQIQEWLGHSDFSTTANIYAHLDYTSKLSSAEALVNGLKLPDDNSFESKWQE